MNKPELVTAMATKGEISKKDAEKALEAFQASVIEELQQGGKVQLVGFGTFEVVDTKPRTGRNLQTGEEIKIPAGRKSKFKAGKVLKDAVK